jgi:DNA-binding HxlR family transcriptional regulator
MATNPPPASGQNQGGIDPKNLRNYLKDIISEQEDLSGVIKDVLRDLNRTEQSYKKIEASIDRISKGAIDVKGVQRDLNKLVDREFIIRKEYNNVNKQQQRDLLDQAKEQAKNNVEIWKAQGVQRDINEELLGILKEQQDHSVIELFYAEKALELAEKRRIEAEATLETEKKLEKSIGIEGKLMKGFADKLGIGAEFYEEMSKQARKLNEEGKKFGFGDKLALLAKVAKESFIEAAKSPLTYIALAYTGIKNGLKNIGNLAKDSMTALTGSGGPLASFISPISNIISKIPLIGGLIGGILDIFANTVDFGIAAASETQKMARSLGISFDEAKGLENSMAAFAESSGKAFLNVKKMREEQMKLSESLGINQVINNEILADSIQLKEQFGLQEESATELARLAIITGRTQTQIFKSLLGQTAAISKVTGVSIKFQEVLKQASTFGGILGLTFTKYPEKLTKSLLVTKALGLDLQKLDSMASGLLDFESSIGKEFEAQLLTGKNINLQKARELALNNDLSGLAIEINKQVGSSAEFLNMNRISQEAYAQATEMSRDELADMLKKQELFAKVGATDLKTFREKVFQMEKAGTLQKEFVDKLTEEQSQYFLSSTATERISNFMERLRQNFATLISSPGFQNLIDKVMTFLEDPNAIDNILSKVTGFFSYIVRIVAAMLDGLDMIPGVAIDKNLRSQLHSYADYLGSGISIGGNAARTQSATGASYGNTPSVTGQAQNQNINLSVTAQLNDHRNMLDWRASVPPPKESSTSIILKGG